MKKMLINTSQPEELRVALVDNDRLCDLDIEWTGHNKTKANVYLAKVVNIEPSLEATFVDYGAARHGFLPFKDISPLLFSDAQNNDPEKAQRVNIKESLRKDQTFIVQVAKEERGNKGAALTTIISLPGRYLVLMPNNPRAGGVSRQLSDEERENARSKLKGLKIPQDMGLILRTAGSGQTLEELQWDLDYLLHLWSAIKEAAAKQSAPVLIHRESDIIMRTIRDYFQPDVDEVWMDNEKIYQRVHDFMQQVIPGSLHKLKLHTTSGSLFSHHRIEKQIEDIFSQEIKLPSGGAIKIDHTEALVAIDINSARNTRGGDIEETALHTNLEAAEEIARQLRLRDLGGLIVIDFIDMLSAHGRHDVENKLRDCLQIDRARVQIGQISRFGLLEMSRQRLRSSLGELSYKACPRCQGTGRIRSVAALAMSALRNIEEEARVNSEGKIIARLPVAVATFLLNEKRQMLFEIEKEFKVQALVIPSVTLEPAQSEIQTIPAQQQQSRKTWHDQPSHKLMEIADSGGGSNAQQKNSRSPNLPAVNANIPVISSEHLSRQQFRRKGFFSKIKSLFLNIFSTEKKQVPLSTLPVTTEEQRRLSSQPQSQRFSGEQRRRGGRGGRGGRRPYSRGGNFSRRNDPGKSLPDSSKSPPDSSIDPS